MFYVGLIVGLMVGAFFGWGITYGYFKQAKIRTKIASEVNAGVAKVTSKIGGVN